MAEYIVSMTIDGNLPSKNRRRKTKTGAYIKSAEALQFAQSFLWQVIEAEKRRKTKLRTGHKGLLSIRARVWYARSSSDLDISLLKDCLQECQPWCGPNCNQHSGIIKNDNQIKHECVWSGQDKHNPRVIFTLYPLEDAQCHCPNEQDMARIA